MWLDGWRSTGIRLASEPTYSELRARVDAEITSGWQVIVAERGKAIIGFVALRPELGKLDHIFVASDALGQSIGKALFAGARRTLPRGFTLWTHGDNVRARRFYETLSPLRWEDGAHPTHGHPIRTYWF